jgi:toluene monooxygenase system ferredoxin subunit
MAFTFICDTGAIEEGGMGFFLAGRKSVLLATGSEIKAYRGRSPDADVPLNDATFNGQIITWPHHKWGFTTAPAASM